MIRCALPLLACALAASASASVVQYINDNPAIDVMRPAIGTVSKIVPPNVYLDVRRDASNQFIDWDPKNGWPTRSVIYFSVDYSPTSSGADLMTLATAPDARIGHRIIESEDDYVWGYGDDGFSLVPIQPIEEFAEGESVGASTADWFRRGPIWGTGDAAGPLQLMSDHAIVGVQLLLDTGTHYGFVEFERAGSGNAGYPLYTAVRWGWETEAGVALVIPPIPAPGAGVLLGLAGLAASRRRR